MYNNETVHSTGDDDDPWIFATVRPSSASSVSTNSTSPISTNPPTSLSTAVMQGTVKRIASPPSALRNIDITNTDDKNRTVRPRNVSKDPPLKIPKRTEDSTRQYPPPHQNQNHNLSPDKSTMRTVSRNHAPQTKLQNHEKQGRSPEKRASTPRPGQSSLGRKFASSVMQPAFEQVLFRLFGNLMCL